MLGGDGDDRLNGGAGDDSVQGGIGDDRVFGGPGVDTLEGDEGADYLNAFDSPVAGDTLVGGPDLDRCFSDVADAPPSLTGADCEGAPTPSTAAYERQFLQDMAVHHHHAVMMSLPCTEREDIRAELQQFCEGIIELQEREIQDMLSWLSEWYGIDDFEPHEQMDQEEMSRMLTEMFAMSPADFERFFLKEMIAHHDDAIALSALPRQGVPRRVEVALQRHRLCPAKRHRAHAQVALRVVRRVQLPT